MNKDIIIIIIKKKKKEEVKWFMVGTIYERMQLHALVTEVHVMFD